MSLINDALIDLDRRQTSNSDNTGCNPELSFVSQKNISFTIVSRLVVILVLIAAGVWVWLPIAELPENNEVDNVIANSAHSEHPINLMSNSHVSELVDTQHAVLAENVTPYTDKHSVDESNEQSTESNALNRSIDDKITVLHKQAIKAFSALRLTKPHANNAYFYYQQILSLEPDNEDAKSGIVEIKEKYLDLYKKALSESDIPRSDNLLVSLRSLLGENEKSKFESKIRRISSLFSDELEEESRIADENQSEKNSVARIDANKIIDIQYSSEQLQKDFLKNIDEYIAQGRIKLAQEKMEYKLEEAEENTLIVDRLLSLYMSQQAFEKALHLIEKRKTNSTRHSFEYARSTLAIYGDVATMAFLEENFEHDYRAGSMYAGLLQKHKRYSEASKLYRKLIADNPNNAVHWLGLAVSLDKLNEQSEAFVAYKKALHLGSHQVNVKEYILRRMNDLATNNDRLELSQW